VYASFRDAVQDHSQVVVAMPAGILRKMLVDLREIYVNYELLVGAGARTAAPGADDRLRAAVGGAFFGSAAKDIRYGCLSLTGQGLPSYGEYFCTLHSKSIQKRVSFLEQNSYAFARSKSLHSVVEDASPSHAVWENRHDLCASKHEPDLAAGQGLDEWQSVLVSSSGDRATDDFVEAHIYGGFTAQSLASIANDPAASVDPVDARIISDRWSQLKGGAP
jgi:hypothetical protein